VRAGDGRVAASGEEGALCTSDQDSLESSLWVPSVGIGAGGRLLLLGGLAVVAANRSLDVASMGMLGTEQ
jgi:hypothetical protein